MRERERPPAASEKKGYKKRRYVFLQLSFTDTNLRPTKRVFFLFSFSCLFFSLLKYNPFPFPFPTTLNIFPLPFSLSSNPKKLYHISTTIMASSNRHWPSMFKSKPCTSTHHNHQWQQQQHDMNSSLLSSNGCHQRSPYSSSSGNFIFII